MAQRLRSYDELVAYLVAQNFPHKTDAANAAVEMPTQAPALPGVVFVRWERKIPFVTIMQQMTAPVPEARVHEVETALSRVNDVGSIPGYAYSYAGKVVYYRLPVPLFEGDLSSDALDRAITIVLNNALQLAPAFQRVIEGAAGATVLDYVVASSSA